MWMGEYSAGDTIDFKFTTRDSGVPYALAGTPAVSIYKDNDTTQSTAGVTLTASFDSVTGLNHVRITTGSDGTFYANGSDFCAVITAGTVNSNSVVGEVVGHFTLRNRAALKPTTAGRTLDVSAGGEAGLDWANIGSPTTTNNLSGTTLYANVVRANTAQAGNVADITLDASASSTNDLYKGETILLTGGAGAGQARTITGYNGTTKIAVVDRLFVTAPDNTTTFAVLGLNTPRLDTNLFVSTEVPRTVIRSGTAQTGSTSTTIKLDSGASSTNNIYQGNLVTITGGTGLGQTRTIMSYVGSTVVATVDRAWNTTPDNTSTFDIYAATTPSLYADYGVAQAGGASSITLASTASATDSIYVGSFVTVVAGTGSGQTREISAYNGTTKVVTTGAAWSVTPDSTSVYAVIPTAGRDPAPVPPTAAEIAQATWSFAGVVDGKTPAEGLIYIAASTAGRVSGAGTGTEVFLGLDEATTRLTVTVDASGNRTDVTYS